MQRIPVRNDEVVWQNIQGEAVLLNPAEGKYFGLNAVGLSFWEKVDGIRTVEVIVDLLLHEYETERDVLIKDLMELVDAMLTQKLLYLK
jgi:hypothetical protein